LRQYIDESTEYEVRRENDTKPEGMKPEGMKLETKEETKPVDMKPMDMKPMDMKPMDMKPEENSMFKPMVINSFDKQEICPVKPKESEGKMNISFNDQLETFEIPLDEENIRIGEDIPLNMLSFEDLEKATPCDIDLGIVEL